MRLSVSKKAISYHSYAWKSIAGIWVDSKVVALNMFIVMFRQWRDDKSNAVLARAGRRRVVECRVGTFEFAVFWKRDEQEMRFWPVSELKWGSASFFGPSFACDGGKSRRLPSDRSHPSKFDLSVPCGFGSRVKHWAARWEGNAGIEGGCEDPRGSFPRQDSYQGDCAEAAGLPEHCE